MLQGNEGTLRNLQGNSPRGSRSLEREGRETLAYINLNLFYVKLIVFPAGGYGKFFTRRGYFPHA